MKPASDPFSELTDIEAAALFAEPGQVFDLKLRELRGASLLEEIKSHLRGNGSIVWASEEDLERINPNLRRFLLRAEGACGRKRVALACYGTDPDPPTAYSKAKSRFAASPIMRPNCAMTERFRLVQTACSELRSHGVEVDTETECLNLFGGTNARMFIVDMYSEEALLGPASRLADAWWWIADALDRECDLSGWFSHVARDEIRKRAPVAAFLEARRAASLSQLNFRDVTKLSAERMSEWIPDDTSFEPARVEGVDSVNMPQHVHDLSAAPAVTLYTSLVWDGEGQLQNAAFPESSEPAKLIFWREIMLAVLPLARGGIAPFLVNRLRASVSEGTGRLIEDIDYPFTRAFDGNDSPYVPILKAGSVHWFRPSGGWPEDSGLAVGSSIRTQYASVWGVRPDVIAIFLRPRIDPKVRPIGQDVSRMANLPPRPDTLFLPESIGAEIERATFVANRSAGIGALLRDDFHRKLNALRDAGLPTHQPPLPFDFERTWS